MLQMSDDSVDPKLKELLREAFEKDGKELRDGIRKALDFSAFGSLCSDFSMKVMDLVWKELGGLDSDPAPWRGPSGPIC